MKENDEERKEKRQELLNVSTQLLSGMNARDPNYSKEYYAKEAVEQAIFLIAWVDDQF